MERFDFGLISQDAKVEERIRSLCKEFGYSFILWKDLEALLNSPADCRVILADSGAGSSQAAAAEFAQAVKFSCPESFIICTANGKIGKEGAAFIKKSGGNLILLEEEVLGSSKPEFAASQAVRSGFLAVKSIDLVPNQPISFDIYHFLPQRQKFIKFAFHGDALSEDKVRKLSEIGEFYIKRIDAQKFNQYTKDIPGEKATDLPRRCRAQYLALYASYSDLILLLSDQSEYGSFKQGELLLQECRDLARELVTVLGAYGNAWDIVNSSAIGESGAVERGPVVAAYAALFALSIEMEASEELMLAALLPGVGLLSLPPAISRKLRQERLNLLTPEELDRYHRYPLVSLELLLERRIPLGEKFRELLVSTHERPDGEGFPHGLKGHHVSEIAQLIRFSREFDERTRLRAGMPRVNREETLRAMIEEEFGHPERYSPVLMSKLKKAFPKG